MDTIITTGAVFIGWSHVMRHTRTKGAVLVVARGDLLRRACTALSAVERGGVGACARLL